MKESTGQCLLCFATKGVYGLHIMQEQGRRCRKVLMVRKTCLIVICVVVCEINWKMQTVSADFKKQ